MCRGMGGAVALVRMEADKGEVVDGDEKEEDDEADEM